MCVFQDFYLVDIVFCLCFIRFLKFGNYFPISFLKEVTPLFCLYKKLIVCYIVGEYGNILGVLVIVSFLAWMG